MNGEQLHVDTISHNLANSNTVGFKAKQAQFQDLVYQTLTQPGTAAGSQTTYPEGLQVGLGSRPVSMETILTQGNFQQTDNPTDLAIEGRGFFQIRRATGELAYTRAGNFHLNRDGNVVTAQGDLLEPQLTIPPEAQALTIGSDGTVSYTVAGQANAQLAGQIQLANFTNPAGLANLGGNLLQATDASGEPIVANPGGAEGLGRLSQGYLESSNVSVVEEFVQLIVSQRAYEANSRVVKAADEMYQQINNLTR